MDMKARTYSQREFLQILKNNGYRWLRNGKGGHTIYSKDDDTIAVNQNINKMVALRLIKEHNLKVD